MNIGLIQFYIMSMINCDLIGNKEPKNSRILSKYLPDYINVQDAKAKDIEDVLILSGDHLYRMDYMDFVQVN